MSVKISRILHAGYYFQCSGKSIIFDPILENPFSGNCFAFPEVKFDKELIHQLPIDAIFISHFHDDHCCLESLNQLVRINDRTPVYIFCLFEEVLDLIRKLGYKSVYPIDLNSTVSVGEFKITARPALDKDIDCIFHIQAEGLNILNVVDSWIDDSTFEILQQTKKWDLILWPFQTMQEIQVLSPSRFNSTDQKIPFEWIHQIKTLNPKYLIPSSCQFKFEKWSWYNEFYFPITYANFQEQINSENSAIQIIKLDPSHSIAFGLDQIEKNQSLPWVKLVNNQTYDYSFNDKLSRQSTADIAQCLAPETPEQKNYIISFCTGELIKRYNTIGPAHDKYFDKSRTWNLRIHCHGGQRLHFFYRLTTEQSDFSIESLNPEVIDFKQVSWVTEIPLVKLYGAIKNGESLNSIYLRINDLIFSDTIEADLQKADFLEDPLLRLLYNGEIGAFQKAQLRKLKNQKNLNTIGDEDVQK